VQQSQAQLDITSIIKKYGGAMADASWAQELAAMEQAKKVSYLDCNDAESVNSSI